MVSPLSVTGYRNYNMEPREINVYVEKNKTYSLGYNIDENNYEFHEINASQ
jgi:hypothetical protein